MGSLFKPKMPSLPAVQPLPEPPKSELSAEEREKIAKDQAAIERKRKGSRSTILTSPYGIETEADIEKKTLLGQ